MTAPPFEFWSPVFTTFSRHFWVISVLSHKQIVKWPKGSSVLFTTEPLPHNTQHRTYAHQFSMLRYWYNSSLFNFLIQTGWYMNSVSFEIIITPTDWETQPQYCSFTVNIIGQPLSKAAPHTSTISINITWELLRKASFQPEILRAERSNLCLTCLPGDIDGHPSWRTTAELK